MPATYSTKRQCPYCGAKVLLGDCPIVATNFPGHEFLGEGALDLNELELPSGTQPLERLQKTGWPVVGRPPNLQRAEQPAATKRSFLTDAFATLGSKATEDLLPPVVGNGVYREDVPARACPECQYPLPQDIDERDAVVIAVVGVNRVGKTHLIAASLTEAYRRSGLLSLGCSEFIPDEATSERFMKDYHLPLFRRREVLEATQSEDDNVRFAPLVFNVTLAGRAPFSLAIHDIAGENLGDYRKRAVAATFLRAARGIIFVIDPRDIEDIRAGLPDWVVETEELGYDQGALLAACLKTNGILEGGRLVPVAITIAKSDLLPQACGRELPFLKPAEPSAEDFSHLVQRIRTTSEEVSGFMEQYGANDLLGPAREYSKRCSAARSNGASHRTVETVTYHAVSALGSQPDSNAQLLAGVRPLNCVDPLAAVLAQIAQIESV